jgi:hypothetical protein
MPAYKHRKDPHAAQHISRSTSHDAPDMIVSQAPNRAPHHYDEGIRGESSIKKKPCCGGCADGKGCEGSGLPHPLLLAALAAVGFYVFVYRG